MSGATSLVVRTLDAQSAERWDRFVLACPSATFFHLAAWQGVIGELFGHRTYYLFAERAGEIVGVLPLAEIKSLLFGHSLSSLPFCAYAGVATEDPAAAAALEQRADEIARERGVRHLEFRNLAPVHADWPRQDLYVTFRKSIAADDDANMNAIPRKQRAMVRKGIKNELRSVVDPDAGRFYELYADNVRRHGTPGLPLRYFAELKRRFGEACEVLTVTDSGGRPVSSVLTFYFRDEALPYYAGDDVRARDLAANDFKYWELMRRAAARGCKTFDFGRSKVGTGPWSFKKNWGFEPQTLAYEYRLYGNAGVPQNHPLNPKYRAFIAVWRKLPKQVTGILGPRLVRYLG